MDNRIRRILLHDHSLAAAQAEVWITVLTDKQTPSTEVRGRLMGPRCLYAGTVEVAYPLRPLSPNQQGTESAVLTMRAVIPEASLWEPQCPFLYEGPIELWQDGQRCDRAIVSHGLRSLQIDERGLLVNGRPLALHGQTIETCTIEDARSLRQAGCNLLLAPVKADTLSLWEQADRFGFLMLGWVQDDSEETRHHLESLSSHASCLGWLLEESNPLPFHVLPQTGLVGLACDAAPSQMSLSLVHFLFGPGVLANMGKPLLIKGDAPPHLEGCPIIGKVG